MGPVVIVVEESIKSHQDNWYVIHTQPKKEEIAVQNLINQAFTVFLPKCHAVRHHARKKTVVLTPLFPRYLFIKPSPISPAWSAVDSTRGVSYILRQRNQEPVPMPIGIVEALMAAQVSDQIVPLSSLALFKPGEKVQVLEGAFAGNVAIYEKLTSEDRVQILLDILGRDIRVSVSIHELASL
jgi:transcriptional antiterminator RfaH